MIIPGVVAKTLNGFPPAPPVAQAATRWEIFVLGSASDLASIAQLEFADTPGGPTLCVGGTAYGPGFGTFANAFDGNLTTYAAATGNYGARLGYIFPTAVLPTEVRLTARHDSFFHQTPLIFVVRRSNDGTTWIETDVLVATDWTASSQQQAFPVSGIPLSSGRENARAWRMLVTELADGPATDNIRCAQFVLAATPGGPTLCVGGAAISGKALNLTNGAPRMIDGSTATPYRSASTNPPWILGFATPTPGLAPVEIRYTAEITGVTADLLDHPGKFEIGWSWNGIDWSPTDIVSGEANWTSGQERTYPISAGTAVTSQWRVWMGGDFNNNADNLIRVAAVEFAATPGGADISANGLTISPANVAGPGSAFDGNPATNMTTTSGSEFWVQKNFLFDQPVQEVRIQAPSTFTSSGCPQVIIIQRRDNDQKPWDTMAVHTGLVWTVGEIKALAVGNTPRPKGKENALAWAIFWDPPGVGGVPELSFDGLANSQGQAYSTFSQGVSNARKAFDESAANAWTSTGTGFVWLGQVFQSPPGIAPATLTMTGFATTGSSLSWLPTEFKAMWTDDMERWNLSADIVTEPWVGPTAMVQTFPLF
jgi:hypothetical protein